MKSDIVSVVLHSKTNNSHLIYMDSHDCDAWIKLWL